MRTLISFIGLGIVLMSCTQELEEKNKNLEVEKQALEQELQQHDSIFQDFITIQENLQAIRARESSIDNIGMSGDVENSKTAKEQILEDIEAINELLEQNRATVAGMNEKMKRYSYEVGKFKTIVSNLKEQISRKDSQIVVLKERLATMNFEVSQLNTRLSQTITEKEQKEEELQKTRKKLNKAYYAIGTFKDLKENGVLSREGGIIGIGSTKTIEDDFNTDYFTEVDKTKTTVIPLNYDVKKIEVISTHPGGSYEVVKEQDQVTSLKIKNTDSFWQATRYLVIILK